MDSCGTYDHTYLLVDRSAGTYDEPYTEYYVCVDCGDTQEINYKPGKLWVL